MISTCPKCKEQVSIPAGVDSAALVRCPICNAEYPLEDALLLAPPELVVVGPTTSDMAGPVAEPTTSIPSAGEEETGGAEAETSPDASLASELGIGPRSSGMATAPAWKARKEKSSLQTLIEIIAGGLAGCLVAYYGLAFWFGPRFQNIGLPQLPLPGISWITAPRDAEGNRIEKPAKKSNGKSGNAKPRNYNHGELLTCRLLADSNLASSTFHSLRT